MTFGENLIRLRRQQGLSQEQLGMRIGVSRQTVSKWELNDTTPEMEKLIAEVIDPLPGVVRCDCSTILSRIKDIKGLRL